MLLIYNMAQRFYRIQKALFMKPGKIHVEPPPADDANKADDQKKKPDKKEPITIHVDPSQVDVKKTGMPDSNKKQVNENGPGSEITDGEDG